MKKIIIKEYIPPEYKPPKKKKKCNNRGALGRAIKRRER